MSALQQKHTIFGLLFVFGLILTFGLLNVASSLAEEDPLGGRKQMFLVTAYYSPLPNQTSYIRGSYEADIRLNGHGTHGANGTPVYPGMLAAPSTYPFGTKIEIPGLGVGTVHDRGGAIISGSNYDRIDVWMGSGEEGLARALGWGARKVEGTIYAATSAVEENLDFQHIPANFANLPSLPDGLFLRNLALGDQGDAVRLLQKHLKELGFFDGPETGNYGPVTESAVFAFQQSAAIVSLPSDHGAGVFGPRTRTTLEKHLKETSSLHAAPVEFPSAQEGTDGERHDIFRLEPGIGKESRGEHVERLQRILHGLGYFKNEISGQYDLKTIEAVLVFQEAHGIVRDENERGAGYFGEKTYEKLAGILAERKERREDFEPREVSELLSIPSGPLVFGEILQEVF